MVESQGSTVVEQDDERVMPAVESRATAGAKRPVARVLSTHGLLVGVILLVVLFTFLLPGTFLTGYNIRSLLGTQTVTLLVALAVVVPMAAGKFDLSVGYTVGITHVLVIGLLVRSGFSWPLAALVGVSVGLAIGLVNGCLVAFARIDSFIATLAVGTFVFGITNWYTQGVQLAGALPTGFTRISSVNLASYVPLPVLYALVVCLLLWTVLEFLPIGRRLYAIGMNPQAAELIGIRLNRYVVVAMVTAGGFSGLAGVILASQLQAGNPGVGSEYLLPAFVAAFLGSTSVRPGRPNVWGTVLAVLLLAVGINGLEHLGAQFYVSSLFNGATLVLAVGIAGYAARRRQRSQRLGRAARGS